MAQLLEDTLNYILSNWGHDVFLQRKTPNGKDWTNVLERHTVRHKYPATRALAQVRQEQSEGIVHNVDLIYYFRADAEPREGDRIYEYDPRYAGKGINEEYVDYGQTTWLVDYALPMRGERGQIVYFMVGVSREEPN